MRIIAFMNQKGGVAKTTTTLNVGAALTKLNKKVLLIDLDPQANLTKSLGLHLSAGEISKKDRVSYPAHTVYELMKGEDSFKECVMKTNGMDVIPSTISLAKGEAEFSANKGQEYYLLKDVLEPMQEKYDFILIDCPPALGLLSLNALAAATDILIPLRMEYLAMEGMSDLMKTIEIVQKRLNSNLNILGIAATGHQGRVNLHQECLAQVRSHFPDHLLGTVIRQNIALAEAPSHHQDVFTYAPESSGAEDYFNLSSEILTRIH